MRDSGGYQPEIEDSPYAESYRKREQYDKNLGAQRKALEKKGPAPSEDEPPLDERIDEWAEDESEVKEKPTSITDDPRYKELKKKLGAK
jgi:hypothetical protein